MGQVKKGTEDRGQVTGYKSPRPLATILRPWQAVVLKISPHPTLYSFPKKQSSNGTKKLKMDLPLSPEKWDRKWDKKWDR